MANLCAGLLAITHLFDGSSEHLMWAARLILVALVFDALDGHVARLTKSSSNFGINFDSLADLTTFGIATSLLLFRLMFGSGDNIGISLVVIYGGCTALRLARFNTTASAKGKKPDFLGLPCPAAAAVVASAVMCVVKFEFATDSTLLRILSVVVILSLSGLMVSKIRYPSAYRVGVEGARPFHHLVVALLLLGLGAATYPAIAVLTLVSTYVAYGVIGELKRKYHRVREKESDQNEEGKPAEVK